MDRPSRIQVLVDVALVIAGRSTCSRLQVGTVIHREGRILTTGYNGAPAGLPHCEHECDCQPRRFEQTVHYPECNTKKACKVAAHAERNAIDWAARHGIRLEGAELVTTDSPCSQCAGSIINSGLIGVVSLRPYRDPTGYRMLTDAGLDAVYYHEGE